MFSLVSSRRYSMVHRLVAGGSEKCAVPHGHNETVTVRLQAVSPAPLDGAANMVEPFERAKATWHRWIDEQVDHALQLSEADPLLAYCLMAKLNAFLAADGGRLSCIEIWIEETPTNTVAFNGDPLAVLPAPREASQCWWRRPDMSINDLPPASRPRAALGAAGDTP